METARKEEGQQEQNRRREFRAALALTGQTAVEFAKALGVSTNHLGLVLRGERQSKRISDAVNTLITSAFE